MVTCADEWAKWLAVAILLDHPLIRGLNSFGQDWGAEMSPDERIGVLRTAISWRKNRW